MKRPIRVLCVDDSSSDRALIRDALEREHGRFRVLEAASRDEFETRMAEGGFDVVLTGVKILGFNDLEVLDAIQSNRPEVPVIVVTGSGSEEVAVRAMKGGAADYVLKTSRHIPRLPQNIEGVLEQQRLQRERDQRDSQEMQSDELLHALAARLEQVAEGERRKIAQELHDRVGQTLTGLTINLKIVENLLPVQAPTECRERLEESIALADTAMKTIRNVMADLVPPVLEEYGLEAALQWQVRRFSTLTGIASYFESEGVGPRLPLSVETGLFRIVQEALTNIARHAKADQVTVRLEALAEEVDLVVSDKGIGFNPEEIRSPESEGDGWGLAIMRERARAIGAALGVDSAPGKGTRITVRVKR
jgi:signal transduction histidine kinase